MKLQNVSIYQIDNKDWYMEFDGKDKTRPGLYINELQINFIKNNVSLSDDNL